MSVSIRTLGFADQRGNGHLRLVMQAFGHRAARAAGAVLQVRVVALRNSEAFRGLLRGHLLVIAPFAERLRDVVNNALCAHVG